MYYLVRVACLYLSLTPWPGFLFSLSTLYSKLTSVVPFRLPQAVCLSGFCPCSPVPCAPSAVCVCPQRLNSPPLPFSTRPTSSLGSEPGSAQTLPVLQWPLLHLLYLSPLKCKARFPHHQNRAQHPGEREMGNLLVLQVFPTSRATILFCDRLSDLNCEAFRRRS